MKDVHLDGMEVLAWVGADEFDGTRGIRSAQTRVGFIPLAFKGEHRDRADSLTDQLQAQADAWGVRIHLARFELTDVLVTLEPCDEPEQSTDPGASICPVGDCGARYDEDDVRSQRMHLARHHPEFIEQRREELRRTDGWVVD